MKRTRMAAGSAITAAVVLTIAAPAAQAHVSIDPSEAEQGGYAVLDLRVPNESDTASTTRLEVHLDPEYPLASVLPQPVPGWDVEVQTAELDEPIEMHGSQITEAPTTIVWSGGEIEPGTFQQFPISVGPLPEDVEQLVFKAVQTYDDGEVSRWIEEPTEDGSEPENPAPVLQLAPGTGGHHGAEAADGTDAASADEAAHDAAEQAAGDDSDEAAADTTARVLAGVGIAVGVAGVAFGVLAGRRRAEGGDGTAAS
ncbi:YcnI family copper-binding membrane protein [Streptomyces mayteni]